jgi:hypothetical protein
MNVNPLVWYSTRELNQPPPHFIRCTTPLTEKSLLWVITKLQGRYSKEGEDEDDFELIFTSTQYISFEDSAEAMLYELRWSGAK